jgi:hypothetical protein
MTAMNNPTQPPSKETSIEHEIGVLRSFAEDCRAIREQRAVDRVEREIEGVRKALREAGYVGDDPVAGIRGLRLLFDAERAAHEPPAEPSSDELKRKLAAGGVFKGFEGVEGLLNASEFWEQQAYGTRLYYGPGITDYLHHGVLETVVKILKTPPAACEPPASLWGDGTREMMIQLRDWLKSKMPCPAGDCCNELRTWIEKVDKEISFHAPAASTPPPTPSPLAKVAAAFAGKVKDSYILKLWFESQEDLDAAFDLVDDVNPILPVVPDSDPTKGGEQS